MNTQKAILDAQSLLTRRRWFLSQCGVGLAGIAATSLMAEERRSSLGPRIRWHPNNRISRAKPSEWFICFKPARLASLELFDNKPELTKLSGQLPPAELLKGYRAAFINPNSALLGPKFKYERHGQVGMELSEVLPHTAKVADEICLIRSMQTDAVNHAPAQMMMNTGSEQFGRPSLGFLDAVWTWQ